VYKANEWGELYSELARLVHPNDFPAMCRTKSGGIEGLILSMLATVSDITL
jgi:hypothetical protein